jgi:hypothetical protein
LDSSGKVAFDGRDAASQRIAIDVAKQNLITGPGSHLRDSVSHGSCAYDADRFNTLRSDACVQSFPFVSGKAEIL